MEFNFKLIKNVQESAMHGLCNVPLQHILTINKRQHEECRLLGCDALWLM
jgi:hypothetical protein